MRMQKLLITGLTAITLTATVATYLLDIETQKETQELEKYFSEYQEAYPIGVQIEEIESHLQNSK